MNKRPEVQDRAAWESIVEEHYQKIYAFTYFFARSREEAEDLTQEAFLKAYKSRSSLRERESVKSWLYTITRHVCIDRKRWWKRIAEVALGDREQRAAEQHPEDAMTLKKLVRELPDRQREVFVLRHWHGFSTEESAKLLGINEGTVKSHLSRAIEKLKQGLTPEEKKQPELVAEHR